VEEARKESRLQSNATPTKVEAEVNVEAEMKGFLHKYARERKRKQVSPGRGFWEGNEWKKMIDLHEVE
jgi:hypothetical protein